MSKDIPLNESGEVIPLNELQHVPEGALPVALSPMQQMQQAKEMGMSVEEMKDMLALQKEYEANEARKAFHVALSAFKKDPPKIYKDLINLKYGSAYSSIGNTVNTCNESMGPYGLNARWDYPEGKDANDIVVTCILAHALGHEEKVTLRGNPDKEGSKNPLQERKSARTYLKLETYEAVTGIASIIGNVDDDANSSGKGNRPPAEIKIINESQVKAIEGKLKDNDLDTSIFTGWISKKFPYCKGSISLLAADHYDLTIAQLDKSIKAKKKA